MHIVLFSDSAAIRKLFAAAERSRTCSISFASMSDLKPTLEQQRKQGPSRDTIYYVDVGSYSEDIKRSFKKYFAADISIGFVDKKKTVSDPGLLFHLGAADYLGPVLLKEEVSVKRLLASFDYGVIARSSTRVAPESSEEIANDKTENESYVVENLIPSNSWKQISSGKEYTFALLYIQIDLVDEWRKKSGKDHLNKVTKAFHSHVEQIAASHDGKVWMWTQQGGVVLFPFDGTEVPVIRTCMKLVLDRILLSTEYYTYNTLITYRMAMHVGNTVYRARGKTGTQVSESVIILLYAVFSPKNIQVDTLFLVILCDRTNKIKQMRHFPVCILSVEMGLPYIESRAYFKFGKLMHL